MRVPEPTEKCAVCAASPIRTTRPLDQGVVRMVGNCRQILRLVTRRCPASSSANSASRNTAVSRLGRAIEAGGPPRLVAAFDDEGRESRFVLIRVHAPQPVLVALEVEREGGKRLRRAEPDEAIRPGVGDRLDAVLRQPPHGAVDAVAADHEVGLGKRRQRRDLRFELQLDAGGRRLLLQHAEQRVPAHPAEAMPRGAQDLPAVMHVDVVPVHEMFRDAAGRPPSRPRRSRPSWRRRTPRRTRRCRPRGSARSRGRGVAASAFFISRAK